MKPYIDMNTKLRTEARNDFAKNLLKLRIIQSLERQWGKLENTWTSDL